MNHGALDNILQSFQIITRDVSCQPINYGYINDTYLLIIEGTEKYILQRLNIKVFKRFKDLQDNIDRALKKLRDTNYSQIEFVKTSENSSLSFINGEVWRLMTYIKDSRTYNTTDSDKVAFEAGRIIGTFHRLLQDELVGKYTDVIPNFHHLPTREQQFLEALNSTSRNFKTKAANEIKFAMASIPQFNAFYKETLPIRICHNDTKLNNILFNVDDKALCLIDLDTLMTGYFHYDFGDAIRTIVNTAEEDERDLSKITFREDLFIAFIQGLNNSNLKLSKIELEFLPLASELLPFIHGLRALTDYLEGSIYYKTTYPDHNLDRCKALFQFTKLTRLKRDSLTNTIHKILN